MTPDLLFRILGDKWLRVVVLLAVLAALAYQVSLVVWQFIPSPEQAAGQQRTQVVRGAADKAGANFQQQANAISRAFLFGKPAVEAVIVTVEEAPETQLGYKLRGVYFSPDERLSSAIVEVKPNKSQHYLLNDEFAENIILAAVEQDHILINRYGKIERLNLQQRTPPSSGRALTTSVAGGTARQTALLRRYKKRYTSNPMALATRFQAIPVQKDGKNIGFKLKPLRGESLLKKLNFEANDVFTAVNGVALSNPFEALDALKSLTTAGNISVTFMRNGAEQTLDFKL